MVETKFNSKHVCLVGKLGKACRKDFVFLLIHFIQLLPFFFISTINCINNFFLIRCANNFNFHLSLNFFPSIMGWDCIRMDPARDFHIAVRPMCVGE